jgi:histidinol dehydrogenase
LPASFAASSVAGEPDPQVEKTVRSVLEAIRTEGDEALIRLTKKFGGPELKPGELRVTGRPKVEARVKGGDRRIAL